MAADAPDCLFIQFAREPLAGSVKTRMMPELSPGQACDLHRELVLWTCRTLTGAGLGPVQLAVAGRLAHPLFEQCRSMGADLGRQRGSNLGERMYDALARALGRYPKVVLVGSDCPAIDREYLVGATKALDTAELVLGPAADGGYVLIGARRILPAVFAGVHWGTETVFSETADRLERLGLRWAALPMLADVDRPEDLPGWRALRARQGSGSG